LPRIPGRPTPRRTGSACANRGDHAMADTFANATQVLEPFRGIKKVTIEEYFSSGHRTCQGCESALIMKLMVKAAGPRTIVLGSTGCMYVANTTYYTTPWVVPWMHTQLGSSGSAALGTAAGLKALMRKGKMAAGHPECRYVATVCGSFAVEMMNKVRRALTIGGPTFIHSLDPCPKGWDYDPMLSHELGELAIETGIFPLYEVDDGVVKYYGKTKSLVEGRARKPVREYLLKQGRFAHFTEEDLAYFQAKVDEMWEKWEIPAVIPFRRLEASKAAVDVKRSE